MDQVDESVCWHSACVGGPNHDGSHVSARGEEFTPRADWVEIAARRPGLIDADGDRWSWCGHGDVYAADEDDRGTEYARADAEREFGPMRELAT